MPIIVSVLGWVLVNAGLFYYYEHLNSLNVIYDYKMPKELSDEFVADGAKRVFALFFGWVNGIIYSLPFVMVYFGLFVIRKLLNGSNLKVEKGQELILDIFFYDLLD